MTTETTLIESQLMKTIEMNFYDLTKQKYLENKNMRKLNLTQYYLP